MGYILLDAKLSASQLLVSVMLVILLFLPQILTVFGFESGLLEHLTSERGFFSYLAFLIILILFLIKILPEKYTGFLTIKKEQTDIRQSNVIIYLFFVSIFLAIGIILYFGSIV